MAVVADGILQRWFTSAFRKANSKITAQMREMLTSCDPNSYISACAAVRDMDLRDSISRIYKPVCILAGEYDPVTTVDDARFLEQRIVGSSLVQLPAAHISNIEAPKEFTIAVLRFLEDQNTYG